MITKCHILADGRMLVAGSATEPAVYEFSALPRLGEKVVIRTRNDTTVFEVEAVKHYVAGVDGDAQTLLSVTLPDGH